MPDGPPSRPYPDSLYPPKLAAASKRLYAFSQIRPARSAAAMPMARDPFSVHTPADSPYALLLAFVTASSGVRNVMVVNTGPKISSRAMRIDGVASVKIVGARKDPPRGSGQDEVQVVAPSATPACIKVVIRSSWAAELIAPTSVFLSIGSPTRKVSTRVVSRARNSSAMDSWTSSREPAQQT